jgi:hypothetical protein
MICWNCQEVSEFHSSGLGPSCYSRSSMDTSQKKLFEYYEGKC